MKKKSKAKCDCKNHDNRVCDVCQGPSGPDKTDREVQLESSLASCLWFLEDVEIAALCKKVGYELDYVVVKARELLGRKTPKVDEMRKTLTEYLLNSTPEQLRDEIGKRKHLQNVKGHNLVVAKPTGKRYNTVREMLVDMKTSKKFLKKYDEMVANDVPLYYDDGMIAGWLDKTTLEVELVEYEKKDLVQRVRDRLKELENLDKKDLPSEKNGGKVSNSEDRMIGYH